MVRRLVGYYEYGNALSDLDELVSLADKEDMLAINEIIAERKEFDVYLSLPAAFVKGAKIDSAETTIVGRSADGLGREFRQKGLAWVTALARVELGAMIAGFTEEPRPFRNITPQSFDYANVMQLLAEGSAHHYDALMKSSAFKEKGGGPREKIFTALKLSRRASIARAMLAPLLAPGAAEYSPEQAYQLSKADSDLEKGLAIVNARLRLYLATHTSTNTSILEQSFVAACGSQLRAERIEIARGTATVTEFPRLDDSGR